MTSATPDSVAVSFEDGAGARLVKHQRGDNPLRRRRGDAISPGQAASAHAAPGPPGRFSRTAVSIRPQTDGERAGRLRRGAVRLATTGRARSLPGPSVQIARSSLPGRYVLVMRHHFHGCVNMLTSGPGSLRKHRPLPGGIDGGLALDSARVRWAPLYRLSIFLPYAVPAVVAALMWGFMYGNQFGLVANIDNYFHVHLPDPFSSGLVLASIGNVVTWEFVG